MIADLKHLGIGFDTAEDNTCIYNIRFSVDFMNSTVDQSQWNFIIFGKTDNNNQPIDMQEKTLTGASENGVLEFSLLSFQFSAAASQCYNFSFICIEFGETSEFLVLSKNITEGRTPSECDEIENIVPVPCAKLGKLYLLSNCYSTRLRSCWW